MTEQTKTRAYEVLMLEGPTASGGSMYVRRDTVMAGSADAAIAAVVSSSPSPTEGRYVAVPTSNWNERDVAVTQVPKVEVSPLVVEPDGQTALTSEDAPEELPPASEPEAAA